MNMHQILVINDLSEHIFFVGKVAAGTSKFEGVEGLPILTKNIFQGNKHCRQSSC